MHLHLSQVLTNTSAAIKAPHDLRQGCVLRPRDQSVPLVCALGILMKTGSAAVNFVRVFSPDDVTN